LFDELFSDEQFNAKFNEMALIGSILLKVTQKHVNYFTKFYNFRFVKVSLYVKINLKTGRRELITDMTNEINKKDKFDKDIIYKKEEHRFIYHYSNSALYKSEIGDAALIKYPFIDFAIVCIYILKITMWR